MKKHIIGLIIGLVVLVLCLFGLKSCDSKISMPLVGGSSQQTETDDEAAKKAAAVDELISKISNPVTLGDESAITAARTAYDQLSDAAKAKVGKLADLQSAETALASLKTADSDAATQAAAVDELIGKISNPVTLEDEAAISAARAAYDKLSDEAKAKGGQLSVLESAETALAGLKGETGSYKVGDIVTFIGGNVYKSPSATKASRVIKSETVCKVTVVVENGQHRYHLISQDGGGVYGWVDAENIREKAGA